MKKILSFLMIFILFAEISNAQFKVMFVNDDDNFGDGAVNISNALDAWGGLYTSIDLEIAPVPNYADMANFDMVIWYTGKDGEDLFLWDVDTVDNGHIWSQTNYIDDLTQYADNGGILWVDAPDGFFDIWPCPFTFSAGDFVYDKLGIQEYSVQSQTSDNVNDNVGVPKADKTAENTFSTQNIIQWSWPTLFAADGFTLAPGAKSLFEMGPASYEHSGYPMMVQKGNYITSSMRLAKMGDGVVDGFNQSEVNTFVADMIAAAQAGQFVSVNNVEKLALNIYPNPVTEIATINLLKINNAKELIVFDNLGKKVYSQTLNSGQEKAIINASNLTSGLYHINIISNNTIHSTKMSVVK